MKILTIGDLHGLDNWLNFEDIKILTQYPNLKTDFDKYIFVGDYTDSYTETNVEILHNLKTLVKFKENYPENVILLWGNHDVQYLYPISNGDRQCQGFRPEAYWDLNIFFREHKDKFQLAYQEDNYIWTHAGIHEGWYKYEFPFNSPNIADDLNGAFEQNVECIFDCGLKRGGFKKQGGPLWADKIETWTKPLKGYHQIAGHTPVDNIVTYFPFNKRDDTSVTYVDCVKHNKYYILEK